MSDDQSPGEIAQLHSWRSALVETLDCSTCKLVGLVLSLYMNEMGGSAFPSNQKLAAKTSLGVSTVREHLNSHLHAHGWLTLIERGGTQGEVRRANSWQASIPNDPRQQLAPPASTRRDPRQQTASPPPAAGPHLSIEQPIEHTGSGVVCSACSETFTTTDALCDHVESDCPVLNGDDFTPAADLKVVS